MEPRTENNLNTQLNWQKAERAPIIALLLLGLGLFVPFSFFFALGWLCRAFGW
jgi:hypothetical protein